MSNSESKTREKSTGLKDAVMVLVVIAIILSATTTYYYYEYSSLRASLKGTSVRVSLGMEIGAGPIAWSNMTIPGGSSLLQAMQDAQWKVNFTNYGPEGDFITSINGWRATTANDTGWLYWQFIGGTSDCWTMGQVAANAFLLLNGSVVTWSFSKYNATTGAAPPPPC